MMTGRVIGHGMYGGEVSMLFLFIFFTVITIAIVYYLIRKTQLLNPTGHQIQHNQEKIADPAETILRERYARGEVSDEEYDQKLKKLRGEKTNEDQEENGIQ